MHLKSFEAIGFKSFADKIDIVFPKGITAVVGPNGSGKSNIADAIRWVLGEQSAKYLRGASMQDVIFAGTQERRPLNTAQVTLTFDNTDANLPIEANEVQICRRLHKSGESEYFINKKNCRLKDIYSLFLDTGIGKGSLFVIGQNRVDEILNSRPEDKRILIEDIAGIVKHKARKQESLLRLEKVQDNLLRINDIKTQAQTNLVTLEKSAAKTREYNDVYAKLKQNNLALLYDNYSNQQATIDELNQKVNELIKEQATLTAELVELEDQQLNGSTQLEEAQKAYFAAQEQQAEQNTLNEKLLGQKELLAEKIRQLITKQQELSDEQNRLTSEQAKITQVTYAALKEQAAEKEQIHTMLTENLAVAQEEYNRLNLGAQDLNEEIAAVQQSININLNNYLDTKNKLIYLEKESQQIKQKIDKNSYDMRLANTTLQELAKTISNREHSVQLLQLDLKEAQSKLQKLQSTLTDTQNMLKQSQEQAAYSKEQLNKALHSVSVLEKLQASYQGFTQGSKNILLAATPWRKDILGAVAQLIEVPKDYILAIETALGSAMQNIITKDEQIAKLAIEHLKQYKLGRATFLPLTTVGNTPNTIDAKLLAATGVVGIASSLVTAEDSLGKILNYLLGRIIIVDILDNAMSLAKRCNYRYKIVTLGGDVLNVGGSLTGGINKQNEGGFLARNEEINQTKKQIDKLEMQLAGFSARVTQYNSSIEELTAQLKETDLDSQSINIKLVEQSGQLVHHKENYTARQTAQQILKQEIETYTTDLSELNHSIDTGNTNLKNLEAKKQQLETNLAELIEKRDTLTGAQEIKVQKLQELTAEVSKVVQELKFIEERFKYFDDNLYKIQQDKKHLQKQYDEAITAQEQLKIQLSDIENKLTELSAKIVSSIQILSEMNGRLNTLSSVQQDLQLTLKEKNKTNNSLEKAIHKYQVQLAEKSAHQENILVSIQEKYQATLPEAQSCHTAQEDFNNLAQKVAELDAQLAAIGSINPHAIEEYEEALEKVQFLQQQYQDLWDSKVNLDKIIADIDKVMAEKFRQSFHELNHAFNQTYQHLFGGGQARLDLVTEGDWLNSGVEIYVQPRGKKLQLLSLLSGGERALTVIALLFALLSLRKTAFCVLDEIDAPLDEANLHKYNNFLIKHSEYTQFILVTHRKPSMQIANNLYGVTMQEPGVSKILSVQIKDVED